MKVLQINTRYINGGSTGRIVADLVDIQQQNGIEPYVAFGFGINIPESQKSFVYRITSNANLFISKVLTKLRGRHGFDNYFETKKLLRWIDIINPDIIHLHNIHNHYINCELLLKYIAQRNISTILTMHDCWTFTGWCAYFDYPKCDKWMIECNNCNCLNKYPRTWIFDRSKKNFHQKKSLFAPINLTIVTPSQWLADLVGKSFLKNKKCYVIHNGVDINNFYPEPSNIKSELGISEEKKIILGMAFNFEERKGIKYFFRLNEKHKEDWQVILVGVSKSQKQLLPKGIIALEKTDSISKLRQLYSIADVFVNPTLEDNFPTTNIESLACGTPVVTFATGGSPESVTQTTGIVVNQNDELGLESAIKKIFLCDRQKLQLLCRERAVTYFDKKKQFLQYVDLYKSI